MGNPLLLAPLAFFVEVPPDAVTMPPDVRAMLDAAMASGNENDVAVIARYARGASAPHSTEIAAVASSWRQERQARETRRLQEASFGSLIKGRAELGGWFTNGNSRNVGVTGVLDLSREGFWWRHKLRLQADYQESFGITSRERYVAAYEPNYKVDDRLYVYGAAQYESDRFLGYHDRYSASAGAGYSVFRNAPLTLNVELGPAFRFTDFVSAEDERNLAARGSIDLDWKLASNLTIRQDTSAYIQDANSTVTSQTALNAKLIGPLSAQLTYQVQYESTPPVGRLNTDTTGRASLVYTF